MKALQKTEKGKEMEELRKKVVKKMQKLWVHASERQRALKEAKDRIIDTKIYASFDYRSWLENVSIYFTLVHLREQNKRYSRNTHMAPESKHPSIDNKTNLLCSVIIIVPSLTIHTGKERYTRVYTVVYML